ncbi:pheromone processing endoprotease [Paramarasmius palmivorus]|uniref:Pheromone processing endoprotease n=1 Tax=Paramarasmius palmivorus TaxID=297713 RepID=A0AAW0B297_9AGAR
MSPPCLSYCCRPPIGLCPFAQSPWKHRILHLHLQSRHPRGYIVGKGVIFLLVENRLDYAITDLKGNFDVVTSYEFNDHANLPIPKLFEDYHGTRCTGQVTTQKTNTCEIGIIYERKVAGVWIPSGPISDVGKVAALKYGYQNVSICQWE